MLMNLTNINFLHYFHRKHHRGGELNTVLRRCSAECGLGKCLCS